MHGCKACLHNAIFHIVDKYSSEEISTFHILESKE